MNSQSIECECGCWNIVVKVVPPGEPCPYCGSSEPHDCCPEKAKALGLPMPEEETCKAADPGGKGGYNVFQFERCDCGCSTLHYVEADEECPSMRKTATARAAREGPVCCRTAGNVMRAPKFMQARTRRCHADAKFQPYGRPKASIVGSVARRRPCAGNTPSCPRQPASCNKPVGCVKPGPCR